MFGLSPYASESVIFFSFSSFPFFDSSLSFIGHPVVPEFAFLLEPPGNASPPEGG